MNEQARYHPYNTVHPNNSNQAQYDFSKLMNLTHEQQLQYQQYLSGTSFFAPATTNKKAASFSTLSSSPSSSTSSLASSISSLNQQSASPLFSINNSYLASMSYQ